MLAKQWALNRCLLSKQRTWLGTEVSQEALVSITAGTGGCSGESRESSGDTGSLPVPCSCRLSRLPQEQGPGLAVCTESSAGCSPEETARTAPWGVGEAEKSRPQRSLSGALAQSILLLRTLLANCCSCHLESFPGAGHSSPKKQRTGKVAPTPDSL